MTYPLDKLGLVNAALSLCGDNLCNTPEDGSDEWNVASPAYEMAIEYMFEAHDWKGLTKVATLARTGTSQDPLFTDTYARPAACVHLIWVKLGDLPVEYQILGNQVVLNASDTGAAGPVTAKFVRSDDTLENVTRTFMVSLMCFVRAGIYGGLHEDPATERAYTAQARAILAEAKTRSDQEQPKRAMFNSRLRLARRGIRPWPASPPGWGR